MASQTLTTNIVINATQGTGIGQLGDTFTYLGSLVSGLSNQIINIGKTSINVYQEYEKSMRDAEGALSTIYGQGTAELATVMSDLDAHAKSWASSTIFHTNDVANAIAEAAHAGYDYNQIVATMPAAMRLAQAGSIDLSTALDYLVKSSYALDLPMDQMDSFVDHWVYTANSSATNVDEIGQAMLRMGSTMRWAADPEEVLTMIAALANVGTTGSKAGTLLRNTMLRLVVPASNKAEDTIENLGFTLREQMQVLEGYFGDEDSSFFEDAADRFETFAGSRDRTLTAMEMSALSDAQNREAWYDYLDKDAQLGEIWRDFLLQEYQNEQSRNEAMNLLNAGQRATFQVYDQSGRLRPMLAIYDDLFASMAELAGTTDGLEKNQSVLLSLGDIYSMRTIQGATALLNGAARGWDNLYVSMRGGKAEGYGQYAADTMMNSMYGSLEIFRSRVENLELVIGERLKPDVQAVAEFFGEVANNLASMDPGTLDAIIRAAEVIAISGPGLLIAGGAFRLIGTVIGSTAGAIALGAIALAAGASAMNEWNEAEYASNFGEMKLDTMELQRYVQGIGTDFERAYQNADQFGKSLEGAVEQYTTASSQLSGKLFNALVMGTELSQTEIDQLMSLGDQMYASLIEGINLSAARSMSYWEALFGGEGEAENSEALQEITDATNEAYVSAMLEAEKIGADLRAAMTAAFDDGKLTDEEYEKIISYINSYNAALAEAAAQAKSEEDYVNMQVRLHKAQTADYDEMVELTDTIITEREETMKTAEDNFWREYFKAQYNGVSDESLTEAEARFREQQTGLEMSYDDVITRMWQSQIIQSGQQESYGFLQGVARQFMSGSITAEEAEQAIADTLGPSLYAGTSQMDVSSNRAQVGRMLGSWLYYMGGSEAVSRQIDYARQSGDTATADNLSMMLAMAGLANNFRTGTISKGIFGVGSGYKPVGEDIGGLTSLVNAENRSNILNALGVTGGLSTARNVATTISKYPVNANGVNMLDSFFSGAFNSYTAGTLGDALSAARTDEKLFQGIQNVLETMRGAYNLTQVADDLGLNKNMDTASRDILSIWALLYGVNSNETVQNLIGGKNYQIKPEEVPIRPKESGANSLESLRQTIAGLNLQTGVRLSGATGTAGIRLFAGGGRADSASLFGEAGPEWAIPEEHSERTAALLNAARAASGFTWADLLARYGGLNAGEGSSTTLIYSPTVQARSTEGVEDVLREDGRSLERMLEERRLRDAAVRYA